MVAVHGIKILFLSSALFLITPAWAPAAEGLRLDLERAIQLALAQNLELKAKEVELGVFKGRATRAALFLQHNPELEGGIADRRAKKREESDRRHHTDVDVRLSQEIEIGGQPFYRRVAAHKEVEKAGWEVEESRQQLRLRVKNLFFTLLAGREKLERARTVVGLRERLYKTAERRVRLGDAPAMILPQSQLELSRARSDLLGLQRDYERSQAEFRSAVGLPPEQAIELEGDLRRRAPLPALRDLLQSALKNRPDLAARDADRQAAEAEVRLTRSERIPNPKLSVFYGREEGNFNIVGGGLSIPLPFFDRRQGELEQALAKRSAADIHYRNLRRTLETNLRLAWERYRSTEAELDLFGENVLEQLQENLELTQRAYEEGRIDIFDLVTAQDRLIEAQMRYWDALLSYHVARAELEKEAALEN